MENTNTITETGEVLPNIQTENALITQDKIQQLVDYYNKAIAKLEHHCNETLPDQKQEAHELSMLFSNFRISQVGDVDEERFFRSDIDELEPNQYDLQELKNKFTARAWEGAFKQIGIEQYMDAKSKQKFIDDISYKPRGDAPPPFTYENVEDTLKSISGQAGDFLMQGLINNFTKLDRRFKSHDPFKIQNRMIMGIYSVRKYSKDHVSYYLSSYARDMLIDIERILDHVNNELAKDLDLSDSDNWIDGTSINRLLDTNPRNTDTFPIKIESAHLRINIFKNGNAHLWFKNTPMGKKIMDKINLILADYYGEVLADAFTEEEETLSKSTAVSKDLAYYPTPKKLIDYIIEENYRICRAGEDDMILEPSAGTGNIALALLNANENARVHCVECDYGRFSQLESIAGGEYRMTAEHANFLTTKPHAVYDKVVMNPPFSGVHFMQHVTKAWEFLKPGGMLFAILPITAEVGESKQHALFHKWIKTETGEDHIKAFRDLPAKSFSECGVNINTTLLTMTKG